MRAPPVIDVFFIGNDFGGKTGPLMGEKLFRRFILPHLKRLVDLGHDYGLLVMMHWLWRLCPSDPGHDRDRTGRLTGSPTVGRGMEPTR